MTLEDPFFIVKEEVVKSVTKTRGLYQRWSELQEDQTAVGKEELEWTTTELRNSLRSIEWDLEDLEETVGIVEKNPRKFKIDDEEIKKRRSFLVETKEEVKTMRENLLENKKKEKKFRPVQNVPTGPSGPGTTKYIRLLNELESPDHQFVLPPPLGQKSTMVGTDGSGNLTRPLGNEADEQAVTRDGSKETGFAGKANQWLKTRAIQVDQICINQASKATWCFIDPTAPPLLYCSGKPWRRQVRPLRGHSRSLPAVFHTPDLSNLPKDVSELFPAKNNS